MFAGLHLSNFGNICDDGGEVTQCLVAVVGVVLGELLHLALGVFGGGGLG